MRYLYITLFLCFCSCGRSTNDNADLARHSDSLEKSAIITKADAFQELPFLDNTLFSYNATSPEKFGDTVYAHEIDSFVTNYTNDGTTFGAMRCYYRATEKTDTLIEAAYQEIFQKLRSQQDKKLFKTAQDNWQNYFASEKIFLHKIFYSKEPGYGLGREHAITQAQWVFQVARQRLILLKNIDGQISIVDEQ